MVTPIPSRGLSCPKLFGTGTQSQTQVTRRTRWRITRQAWQLGFRENAAQLVWLAAGEEFEGMGQNIDHGLNRLDRTFRRSRNVEDQALTH